MHLFFFQVTAAVTARVVVIFSHVIDEKSFDSQGIETKSIILIEKDNSYCHITMKIRLVTEYT